ncbi:ATP-binding protein [Antrihabitans sp. YC2-6]|uniref:ATP-binding protein n=1 Tax=Antrihabitans stalagmiti TaxID=2799499 RepID=A0A934NWQ6_9NOCA|nr:ATP-binding protein [Antrihabitans stalagmiti]MBJ8344477.1 ATP-binding protein [Antrihabitans sp. YC2-6]
MSRHFTLDLQRRHDMLQAVYEALANAAEHAYPDTSEVSTATMDLHVDYDATTDVLQVSVCDHGQWDAPVEDPRQRRDRGIPLMHALADTHIESGSTGTQVRRQWHCLRIYSVGR